MKKHRTVHGSHRPSLDDHIRRLASEGLLAHTSLFEMGKCSVDATTYHPTMRESHLGEQPECECIAVDPQPAAEEQQVSDDQPEQQPAHPYTIEWSLMNAQMQRVTIQQIDLLSMAG